MSTTGKNSAMGVTLKGTKKVSAFLKAERVRSEKAMNTAIRVEAFQMKKQLQKDLRSGKAGGSPFDALSFLARRMTGRPNRKVLAKLAMGVRYRVAKWNPFKVEVGFIKTTSESFRRLASIHQQGFTRVITQRQRSFIINRGAKLGQVEGGDTPFFLSKRTKLFKTPARPIIDPFWRAHQKAATANIKRNFKLKLKGQRI